MALPSKVENGDTEAWIVFLGGHIVKCYVTHYSLHTLLCVQCECVLLVWYLFIIAVKLGNKVILFTSSHR